MKVYVFRDVFTGRLYKSYGYSSAEAKAKVAMQKNIRHGNLAIVKRQEKVNA